MVPASDQDRIGPEAPDTLHQSSNLAFRMTPRVAGIFFQVADQTPDHITNKAVKVAAVESL